MLPRRYSVVIADPSSGVERRLQLPVRPVVAVVGAVVTLPVLIGLGAAWKAKSDVAGALREPARARARERQLPPGHRGAVRPDRIAAVGHLRPRDALGARPGLAKAMANLPALREGQGDGRRHRHAPAASAAARTPRRSRRSPTPTTRSACCARCSKASSRRLSLVKQSVDRRDALAAATPSIWPAHGWLSSPMGYRTDPVNGGRSDFHPGLDIAGDTRPAGLRHRRRHGRVRRQAGQLRQPDRHRPRLRPRNALRPPAVVLGEQGRHR